MNNPSEKHADNLLRLTQRINSCKHPRKVFNALTIILSAYADMEHSRPAPGAGEVREQAKGDAE